MQEERIEERRCRERRMGSEVNRQCEEEVQSG